MLIISPALNFHRLPLLPYIMICAVFKLARAYLMPESISKTGARNRIYPHFHGKELAMQSFPILLVTCRGAGLQLSQDDLLHRKSVGFPGKLWPAAARPPRNSIGTDSASVVIQRVLLHE